MKTYHLERKQVPATILGAYQGRDITVEVCESVHIPMDAGLWSGGTRELYTAIRLSDGAHVPMADHASAPWSESRAARTYPLQPGYVVVQTGTFCGRDAGLHIYVHPDNAAPLLPAHAPELSRAALIVLDCACSLKSAYRTQEYRRQRLSDADVTAAKAELLAAKLIAANGAPTPAGRNSRQRMI
jgi:hypothetical protein